MPQASLPSSTRRLWWRWVVAFTVGELVGFGLIPVALGVLAWWATEGMETSSRAPVLYLVAVLGGLGEGAVLARFQLSVLEDVLPGIRRRAWILHTSIAASLAWAAGMLAPTLDDLVGLPVWAQIAIWVPASIFILLSIGTAQARLLSRHVPRPWRWLVANVVGWLAGLPWTFVLPALVPDDAPPLAFALALFVGGVLMGATTGAITGAWLVRIARERE